MEKMNLFSDKREHPVWNILNKEIYTEEGIKQAEEIYDFIKSIITVCGNVTKDGNTVPAMKVLFDMWNEFSGETFAILKKLTASDNDLQGSNSSHEKDTTDLVPMTTLVDKLIAIHDEMEKENCQDTRTLVIFDAINRIRSLECEVGALLKQEANNTTRVQLNESILCNLEELHAILEAKDFEDFYLQVLSDVSNYIERLEQDNVKLHNQVGKLGEELILDE